MASGFSRTACYDSGVEFDASGWSGEGEFTSRLIAALKTVPAIRFLKVGDAPANPGEGAFSFISNEVFVAFGFADSREPAKRFGFIPAMRRVREKAMTLHGLQDALAASEIGAPDYEDSGMLQYLRTERIVPPYQTRGYKLVELVRIYEAGEATSS